MRGMPTSKRLQGTLIVIVVLMLAALILISPIGLSLFKGIQSDWGALSEIGQAYGGITAVLSALALCAISASLLLQHRQAYIAQVAAVRTRQIELVKIGIENPSLMRLARASNRSEAELCTRAYINLWMTQWHMAWDLGWESEHGLRRYAGELFTSPLARSWWSDAGASYAGYRKRRYDTFYEIVNEEWRIACQQAGIDA